MNPFRWFWTLGISCLAAPCCSFAADVSTLPAAVKAVEGVFTRNERLTADETKAAETLILQALRNANSPEAQEIGRRLYPLLLKAEAVVPDPNKPIALNDTTARLTLGLRAKLGLLAAPKLVKPDPSADYFPGAVPKSLKRVTKKVTVDATAKGYIANGYGVSDKSDIWHSTGVYAAPGETIRVTIPAPLAGRGLRVRIGCHSDGLWRSDSWKRAPEVSRVEPLATATTSVANPFGGLVYILVPPNADPIKIPVTVADVVEAPLYLHGITKPDDWRKSRQAAAPWAELVGKNLILTVPSSDVRMLENPEEIVAFWDEILDACATFTAVPTKRGRAERFVHDVQISTGYMHSGYPIMGPLNEAKTALDLTKIRREGAWGYFHELGHNHQQREWTPEGTVEVTCNFYSLYLFGKFCPQSPLHGDMRPAGITRNVGKYRAGGSRFEDWKKEPFVALVLYKQLADEFGWETFTKVFAEYHALTQAERPMTDVARRDQFCVRFSRMVGKSLVDHFESWGVPISADVKRSLANLPSWTAPASPTTPPKVAAQ